MSNHVLYARINHSLYWLWKRRHPSPCSALPPEGNTTCIAVAPIHVKSCQIIFNHVSFMLNDVSYVSIDVSQLVSNAHPRTSTRNRAHFYYYWGPLPCFSRKGQTTPANTRLTRVNHCLNGLKHLCSINLHSVRTNHHSAGLPVCFVYFIH